MNTVLWRRLDQPGHDCVRIEPVGREHRIRGAAVFQRDDGRPCRLEYEVVCDEAFATRSATVTGWIGDEDVRVEIVADATRTWWIGGVECPDVKGCADVDLHFTPATNTLPIRRLALPVGGEAVVRAAWLAPDLTLQPLEQVYRRTGPGRYGYESAGGFTADLDVDDSGLVVAYSGLWERE